MGDDGVYVSLDVWPSGLSFSCPKYFILSRQYLLASNLRLIKPPCGEPRSHMRKPIFDLNKEQLIRNCIVWATSIYPILLCAELARELCPRKSTVAYFRKVTSLWISQWCSFNFPINIDRCNPGLKIPRIKLKNESDYSHKLSLLWLLKAKIL